jgi:Spy/CpxP family protein refolding chaperone
LSLQRKYGALFSGVVLVIGLAIGFGGATLVYRYGLLPLPGERPFQRMARVLQLTPAQREQIRTVMHDTRGKMGAARNHFEQQRHEIFLGAYLRIRALLTPSQQTIFDQRFVPPSLRAQARAQLQHQPTPAQSASAGAP